MPNATINVTMVGQYDPEKIVAAINVFGRRGGGVPVAGGVRTVS